MTTAIELYCKHGHDPVKVMISGINGLGGCTLAVNDMDKSEIRFVCRRCGLVFNTIEVKGREIVWNSYRKVGKMDYFDERGNIITK